MSEENSQDLRPMRLDISKASMTQWRGMMMPTFEGRDMDAHFDSVLNMPIREDDVMLLSFPKSGTHWLWRIMDLILHQTIDYGDRCLDYGFLELQPPERIANWDPPRILSTHLPIQYLPKQVKDKRIKLVHVYRNPKAVLVSMYFMMKTNGLIPDITLDKMVALFCDDTGPMLKYTEFWDQVVGFEKDNPDIPFFHVAYEDLKLNTADYIKKLTEFLGVTTTTQDLREKIAAAVGIKKQTEEETRQAHGGQNQFYRKGESNDWKNHLTVAQSERLDHVIKKRAARCRFSAKYVTSD